MRISDWSSDVCSSDLRDRDWHRWRRRVRLLLYARDVLAAAGVDVEPPKAADLRLAAALGFAQDLAVLKCDCVASAVFSGAGRTALKSLLHKRLKHARAAVERRARDRKSTRLNSSH